MGLHNAIISNKIVPKIGLSQKKNFIHAKVLHLPCTEHSASLGTRVKLIMYKYIVIVSNQITVCMCIVEQLNGHMHKLE